MVAGAVPPAAGWRVHRGASINYDPFWLLCLLSPHIVGINGVLVPQEELAVGDDRMAPGRARAGLEGEAAMLLVACRIGFRQPNDPALAEEIEPVVREDHRALAHAAVLPGHLAGVELHRRQDRAGKAI